MTGPENLDPALLDDLITRHANSWYSRGCIVGKTISDLPAGEYRDKLVAYMNLPVRDLGHSAIINAIRETIGVELRGDSLLRHRRHSCGCAPEVYK